MHYLHVMFARLSIVCVRASERTCVREGSESVCVCVSHCNWLSQSHLFANFFAVFGCVGDYITLGLFLPIAFCNTRDANSRLWLTLVMMSLVRFCCISRTCLGEIN